MPVLSSTAYGQAEDALNLTRALVNDSAGTVFNDTTLMPLLNSAYRGLQRHPRYAELSSGSSRRLASRSSSLRLISICL
jgi:hypothetical protein